MSAAVSLQATWLNDALNPADVVALYATDLTDTPDTGGAVRTYAGGRRRYVAGEGVTRRYTLTLTLVTAAQLQWIEDHVGRVVCLRDFTGMRRWVTYTTWQRAPRAFANRHEITSFTLVETTFSDAL